MEKMEVKNLQVRLLIQPFQIKTLDIKEKVIALIKKMMKKIHQ